MKKRAHNLSSLLFILPVTCQYCCRVKDQSNEKRVQHTTTHCDQVIHRLGANRPQQSPNTSNCYTEAL